MLRYLYHALEGFRRRTKILKNIEMSFCISLVCVLGCPVSYL
jgi:hypothetical protein